MKARKAYWKREMYPAGERTMYMVELCDRYNDRVLWGWSGYSPPDQEVIASASAIWEGRGFQVEDWKP